MWININALFTPRYGLRKKRNPRWKKIPRERKRTKERKRGRKKVGKKRYHSRTVRKAVGGHMQGRQPLQARPPMARSCARWPCGTNRSSRPRGATHDCAGPPTAHRHARVACKVGSRCKQGRLWLTAVQGGRVGSPAAHSHMEPPMTVQGCPAAHRYARVAAQGCPRLTIMITRRKKSSVT